MPQAKTSSQRLCLSCRRPFNSAGNWNRICPKCKQSPKFREHGLEEIPTSKLKEHHF